MSPPLPQKKIADMAKARFADSLSLVKDRLKPANLTREMLDRSKTKAVKAVGSAIIATKARPAIAVGVAAAATLFLFRKPIANALKRAKEKSNG